MLGAITISKQRHKLLFCIYCSWCSSPKIAPSVSVVFPYEGGFTSTSIIIILTFLDVCLYVDRKCTWPAPTPTLWSPQNQTPSPTTQDLTAWSGWWDLFWLWSSSSASSSPSSSTKSECDTDIEKGSKATKGSGELPFKLSECWCRSCILKYIYKSRNVGVDYLN